jgi:hypothetical protein
VIKHLILIFTFASFFTQDLTQLDLERAYFKTELNNQPFEYQQPAESSSSSGFLLSLLVPGLDQYLNDRYIVGSIFAGLEVGLITMAIHYNSEGDEFKKIMKAYANNESTGFSRVKYYKNIYENQHGEGSADANLFNLNADEERQYQEIRNSDLWDDLKRYEKEHVGDGVHSLPGRKTQQFYEMIGKYGMFYHGWRGISLDDLGYNVNSPNYAYSGDAPQLIDRYYRKRDKMNDAYKSGTFAFSGIVFNHLFSGLEALINQKRRVNIEFKQDYERLERRLEVKVDL